MKTLYKIVNYLNCGIWHNSNNSKKISNIFVIYKNFLGFFWPSINKVNKNSLEKIISRKGELQLKIDTLFQKQLVYNLIILNNTTCWNILLTLPLNKKKMFDFSLNFGPNHCWRVCELSPAAILTNNWSPQILFLCQNKMKGGIEWNLRISIHIRHLSDIPVSINWYKTVSNLNKNSWRLK